LHIPFRFTSRNTINGFQREQSQEKFQSGEERVGREFYNDDIVSDHNEWTVTDAGAEEGVFEWAEDGISWYLFCSVQLIVLVVRLMGSLIHGGRE